MKTRLYLIKRQPENLDEHLAVLNDVTDRMRRLVEDLLDVSRFEHGVITLNREPVVLQELIQTVINVQRPEAETRSLSLSHDLAGEPLRMNADPSRLVQVITNLLTNAINYTPAGGKVMVTACREARQSNGATQSWALITVTDTGIGIAPTLQSEVFKPFFRINDYSAGVGLGLSITREIVDMHGGEIVLESEPDKGTTFSVWLPLSEE